VATAQFKSQLPVKHAPPPNSGQEQTSTVSLLDPQRLAVNHGFSFQMGTTGGQSFSYGVYSNRLSYLISTKWSLNTQLDFVQPTHGLSGGFATSSQRASSSFPGRVNGFTGQVYYGAQLKYQPSEHLQFSIGLDNYPRIYYPYYTTRPVNRYSPILPTDR
ncbi:MAG: hypothetical protein ACE5GH_01650, partial [Fidelibacterota bacterium]